MPGFSFGSTTNASTANASPFNLSTTVKSSAPTLNLSGVGATSNAGFSFGQQKTTANAPLLPTPGIATSAPTFSGFGQALSASSASTGLSFNVAAPTTTSAAPGGLGGFNFGLNKPAATTTTTSGFGMFGATTSAPTLGGAGGLAFNISAPSTVVATGTNIFSSQPTQTSTVGLGGVDPAKALNSGSTSQSDGKTIKESLCPPELVATVDSLQKYVKEEKSVREEIARMSSKPLIKVQEDVTAVKQLLSVVANGLQQNANAVDKLKLEMTQNLKNAEMAQRTKEIPAGLQYENTAPTEYFQRLVEEFEERMIMYRQQIETLDNHLAALHQPVPHSPAEVLSLMKKLHETFLSLAAQLHQVHEAVKIQKDQFLAYKRVFHGDNKNIFQRPTPISKPLKQKGVSSLAGPNPFVGTTNAAANAMAMVHNRAQQPQGPPITGLVGESAVGNLGIFGTPKPTQGFGSLNFGGTSTITGAGSLFSSIPIGGTTNFGTPPTLGSSTTAALNLAGTNMSANTRQPFMLQKPPQGAKRGKR